MKTTVALIAFVIGLSLPSMAQTKPTLNETSPQMLQMLTNSLLRNAGSGHGFQAPQQKANDAARLMQIDRMRRAGEQALHDGDFVAAETDFRNLTEIDLFSREAHYKLGEALAGQGRTDEAITSYRAGIYWPLNTATSLNDTTLAQQSNPKSSGCPNENAAVAWMKCVLLLSQTGQAKEASTIYKEALPLVPDIDAKTIIRFPDAGILSPAALQASAHIALGLCATFGSYSFGTNHAIAMSEFDKACHLQPDAPLTNYYYGYGWQNLAPNDRVKLINEQQAKAALQKAVRLGKGAVKEAAQKALLMAMKIK